MTVFVTVSIEIRAPRAHVHSIASRPEAAADWLWAPAQVATVASSRDLPDGTRQLVIADGDKLRDKVVEKTDELVVLESELRPRKTDRPGRHLRYELTLESALGCTAATLGIGFLDRDAPAQTVQQRKWRRHAEQCLSRLNALAVGATEEEDA